MSIDIYLLDIVLNAIYKYYHLVLDLKRRENTLVITNCVSFALCHIFSLMHEVLCQIL